MKQAQCVLVLDAGGPGSMAVMRLVRDAGLPITLIAADMDPDCAAKLVADVFVVIPPANSPKYLPEVKKTISRHNVDVVMPSFHFGYEKLRELDGNLFIGSLDTALLCQDKWAFYRRATEHDYLVPRTTLLADTAAIEGKSYLKPRYGAGAKDNYTARSTQELNALRTVVGSADYLVQDFADGQQWSVEVLQLGGELVSCSTLRVITHKAGNTVTASVEDNQTLTKVCSKLLTDLGYEGPANLDFIQTNRGYELLELNPRFGSTVQFVGAAGHNTPAYLLSRDSSWLGPQTAGYYTVLGDVKKIDTNRYNEE